MLVYKRITYHLDHSKKLITPKINYSTFNHTVDLQNPSVTLIRDPINIAMKGKRLSKENRTEANSHVEGKKTKFELEMRKTKNHCINKQISSNGAYAKFDKVNVEIDDNHELQQFVKNSKGKMDFMTMSCHERETIEEVLLYTNINIFP